MLSDVRSSKKREAYLFVRSFSVTPSRVMRAIILSSTSVRLHTWSTSKLRVSPRRCAGKGRGGGGRWSDRKTVLSVCKGEEWSYSKRVLVVHSLLQARK